MQQTGFACTSSSFTEVTKERITGAGTGQKKWVISYSSLSSSTTESAPITIACRKWRNPVYPQEVTDFYIITTDAGGAEMDKSDPFSLYAADFTPYQAVADDLTYTLGSKLVQQETTYMIEFDSHVPLEIDTDGCYIKYNFPREL